MIPEIAWGRLLADLASVGVAYLLALPIAWDRARHARSVGLRTFPLVAVASCGFILLSIDVFGRGSEAGAHVLQGLMTGVGFIGGGAILKQGLNVRGTATAASLWTTGAIGAAAGYGRYELAIVLTLINFLTLSLLSPWRREHEQVEGDTPD
jgi:putative Mg2+ transporter-C (MgtC) family protein